uniref:OAR domain-containing protein n=1 Tax=Knipowitschia caucasica TaxID=637954 RepID=A0AAV2KRM4_KNICA
MRGRVQGSRHRTMKQTMGNHTVRSGSAMASYPPSCSNAPSSQGMNMASSIANLRLKAKEYSLNQVPTVN